MSFTPKEKRWSCMDSPQKQIININCNSSGSRKTCLQNSLRKNRAPGRVSFFFVMNPRISGRVCQRPRVQVRSGCEGRALRPRGKRLCNKSARESRLAKCAPFTIAISYLDDVIKLRWTSHRALLIPLCVWVMINQRWYSVIIIKEQDHRYKPVS